MMKQDVKASSINAALVLEEVRVLDEKELRLFGRNVTHVSPNHGSHSREAILRELGVLSESLFRSAEAPRISSTHRTAACNAFCGFLEHGTAAPDHTLREFCRSAEVWNSMLDLYFHKAADMKPKVIRQLLMTIVRFVTGYAKSHEEDGDASSELVEKAAFTCFSLVYAGEERSSVRAAMNLCDVFLAKQIIPLHVLYKSIAKCKDSNGNLGSCDGDALSDTTISSKTSMSRALIEDLVVALITWVRYPDTASSAGRLLRRLFIYLQGNMGQDQLRGESHEALLPIWVSPLKQTLSSHPELLEPIGNHVLPELLKVHYSDSLAFLNSLPLAAVHANDLTSVAEEDISFSLTIFSILGEKGLDYLLADPNLSLPAYGSGLDPMQGIQSGLSSWNAGLDTNKLMTKLLVHGNAAISIASLAILTSSPSHTKPFTKEVLSSLKHELPSFHAESDSKSRGEYISIMRKVLRRLDSALFRMLHKPIESVHSIGEDSTNFESRLKTRELLRGGDAVNHLSFLHWYIGYLLQELQPTASYQRHIIALKLLQIMQKGNLLVMSQADMHILPRLITDLVVDPFEDVREAASQLLMHWAPESQVWGPTTPPSYKHIGDQEKTLFSSISVARLRAERLMIKTSRADVSDGAGRLAKVAALHEPRLSNSRARKLETRLHRALAVLEEDIKVAKMDIRYAVSKAPLHGRLVAVRYLTERLNFDDDTKGSHLQPENALQELTERLIQVFEDVWTAVKEILCFDSPEGHVPEDVEENNLEIGTKDTLSFSWRALKESSSLMCAMIANASLKLAHKDLIRMGDLAFIQLAELRHRGAFSTVAQTFAACCSRCAQSDLASVASLPTKWYNETLLCIESKSTALTRRSAGLPAMITSNLTAISNKTSFSNAIHDLQKIAKSPVDVDPSAKATKLPQVHALNSLKDVFSNTRLGPSTEMFLADTLEIAVGCLDSPIWAIRNCGLMLFKALLTRLAGGQSVSVDNRKRTRSSKTIYENFPSLSRIIVRLLQAGSGLQASQASSNLFSIEESAVKPVEVIYPAMEIIEKIGIPSSIREAIVPRLVFQLENPISGLREKAAGILSHELDMGVLMEDIDWLLEPPYASQNALHGWLHCLKLKIGQSPPRGQDTSNTIGWLLSHYDTLVTSNPCPFTAATYLEVLYLSLKQLICNRSDISNEPWQTALFVQLEDTWDSMSPDPGLRSHKRPGQDLLVRALVSVMLVLTSKIRREFGFKPLLHIATTNNPALLVILEGYQECIPPDGFELEVETSVLSSIVSNTSTDWTVRALALDIVSASLSRYTEADGPPLKSKPAVASSLHGIEKMLPIQRGRNDGSTFPLVYFNSALVTSGSLLALRPTEELVNSLDLPSWLKWVDAASDDLSDLSSRLASVKSLSAFKRVLRSPDSHPEIRPQLLDAYLAIYDTLLDDDDDVRDQGSSIVSWVLSNSVGGIRLKPLAAVPTLLKFLSTEYADSQDLCINCLARLTGTKLQENCSENSAKIPVLTLNPASNLMHAARQEDHSLFAEEKQNLFRDDVQEAQRMAQLLGALSPSLLSASLLASLRDWTCAGLEVMTDIATNERDGPLGWTSKPAVYTLGMRILCAAGVAVTWDRSEAREVEAERMMGEAKRFLEAGRRTEVHGLWIREAERVLGEAVEPGMEMSEEADG